MGSIGERVAGIVKKEKDGRLYLDPINKNKPKLYLNYDEISEFNDNLVYVAKIDDTTDIRKNNINEKRYEKIGEVTDCLGFYPEHVLDQLRNHNIDLTYPKAVIDEANEIPNVISEAVMKEELQKGRKDFTNELVVTIDGENTKDIDDAVSLKELENGNYLLKKHIAHVSYYVKLGSAIQEEARKRGTSIYFQNNVVPMLVKKLSNGICSLNEGVYRFARTAIMEVTPKGEVINFSESPSIIKSYKKMTYTNVDKILEGDDEAIQGESKELVEMLNKMNKLAQELCKKRKESNSIEVNRVEYKFYYSKDGKISMKRYEPTPATNLIKEFALLANHQRGKYADKIGVPFIYRNHKMPNERAMDDALCELGKILEIDNLTEKEAIEILYEECGGIFENVISNTLLSAFSGAEYSDEIGFHYGLGIIGYAHTTSPIRRYPDLFNQYVMDAYEMGNIKALNKYRKIVESEAIQSTYTQKGAKGIQRNIARYDMREFMNNEIGELYIGYVENVHLGGTFEVRLPNGLLVEVSGENEEKEIGYHEGEPIAVKTHNMLKGTNKIFGDVVDISEIDDNTEFSEIIPPYITKIYMDIDMKEINNEVIY